MNLSIHSQLNQPLDRSTEVPRQLQEGIRDLKGTSLACHELRLGKNFGDIVESNLTAISNGEAVLPTKLGPQW